MERNQTRKGKGSSTEEKIRILREAETVDESIMEVYNDQKQVIRPSS